MFEALSLLKELAEDDIHWLLETGEEQTFLSHATVTTEGVRPDALYVVLEGLLEVSIDAAAQQRLATLGPGELIGEVSLLEDRPASATVRAVESSLLLAVPRDKLSARLQDPQFASRWYKAFALILARRLRERVLSLTQQLRARESQAATASAWQPLRAALDALKARLNSADQQALKTGTIEEAPRREIEAEFLHFCGLMNETIGASFGMAEHLREELGYRVRLELLPYLLLTECAERTYSKPRGYAGDFLSIEMIYNNQPHGSGRLGPLVDRCFLSIAAAQAVRNRRGLLAEEIRRTCALTHDRVVRITSLACGPAEEVFDVVAAGHDGGRLQATLIDIDAEAVAFVERHARERGVSERLAVHTKNLIYLAVGRHRLELPPQDLVYSIGLIDYFNDEFVIRLINYAHRLLKPGGRLILGNFHPRNSSRALLDYVVDWRLIHRTDEDMHRLFQASVFGRPCDEIRFEAENINLFAVGVKT